VGEWVVQRPDRGVRIEATKEEKGNQGRSGKGSGESEMMMGCPDKKGLLQLRRLGRATRPAGQYASARQQKQTTLGWQLIFVRAFSSLSLRVRVLYYPLQMDLHN
jgi:hypothetical protein